MAYEITRSSSGLEVTLEPYTIAVKKPIIKKEEHVSLRYSSTQANIINNLLSPMVSINFNASLNIPKTDMTLLGPLRKIIFIRTPQSRFTQDHGNYT